MNTTPKRLLLAQSSILVIGVGFSWTTIISRFVAVQSHFGTIFTFGDSSLTSPILTPCFYGGLAFIIAFGWSFRLFAAFDANSQRYLSYLLLFGALFAASVLSIELCQYYRIFGGPLIACTPGVYPLAGPCAIGGLIYLFSFIISRVIVYRTRA